MGKYGKYNSRLRVGWFVFFFFDSCHRSSCHNYLGQDARNIVDYLFNFGAFLGDTLVAICMAFALVGGILAIVEAGQERKGSTATNDN